VPQHETALGAETWPVEELETVERCPFCGNAECSLAYANVEDWTFDSAPGRWNYWRCKACAALYLNPRPTQASIARAYTCYYTHDRTVGGDLKTRIRHSCYFAWYGIALEPRLRLPTFLHPLLAPLRFRLAKPSFMLFALDKLPPGRMLLDLGCGNGIWLAAARQLGWETQGVEIDPQAVRSARAAGLDVIEAGYEIIADWAESFDCVICSHVIEHVYDPLALLRNIYSCLKPGGVALISLPNAGSEVLSIVGGSWRGLEAPRHLAIPDYNEFLGIVKRMGFQVTASHISRAVTLSASLSIAEKRGLNYNRSEWKRFFRQNGSSVPPEKSDFINLELKK